ncbi:ergothioneine biosynthesis glutamate--cysteine ligase EgtA [Virgisporangium ochraceum]|uniref:Glutamate--cysteine ligase EgtA n=1 Tax=Virgisporangium ochraceum TaxID=65505 RepID=A0A8J3ZM76_9ACTN|nr:ergothioneine biosynthesis glutamate--cysteine ligase EgtA [Virgisporangium ochraceum]GIJ65542.1 glutamate--cysteine ligase EgtA [Virgisporangium ochraceum]
MTITVDGTAVVNSVADAEGYIARVCFKTGPPESTGVELEWTVHHRDDPARPLDISALRAALGPHAPLSIDRDSPAAPLPGGSPVTVEPGGQVEISTPPAASPATLYQRVEADIAALQGLLARHGLVLGRNGIDPHRPPAIVVQTPRYAAMTHAFQPYRPYGDAMMRSTAGLQVCVDAGVDPTERWRALHTLGPALLAAFATSRRHAGHDTGWASARMRAWLRLDPRRTAPVYAQGGSVTADAWVRYAMSAPLLCVRRDGDRWKAPPDSTFADWIGGALDTPPTHDDLSYHLTTLFPPVRPRGYLEVRYLDTQPPGEWIAPVAVVMSLLSSSDTIAEAERRAAPAIDRWEAAARHGTADPAIADAARGLLALALENLPVDTPGQASDLIRRRLDSARGTAGETA